MKNLLKLEELALFALAIAAFTILDMDWWWFPLLLLAPDLGMLGYLAGPRVGANTYNSLHHRGLAILVYLLGVYLTNNWLAFAGIILFAHSSLDRVFGYGLKYSDSFQHTHLGKIGRSS